jgi:hypothetical protein
MQFRTIVSAFFFDQRAATANLAAMLERAGVRNVEPLSADNKIALGVFETERQVLGGTWGVFEHTWALLDQIEEILCLHLYSPYTRFVEATINEEEHGPDATGPTPLAYVRTFGEACEKLDPIAGLLDTRAHYEIPQWSDKEGIRDWVLARAKSVAARDVNALADERISVLYLSELMMLGWQSSAVRDDRDMIELARGRLIFARRGRARMA